MGIFKHEGAGIWVGSYIVVVARDQEEAERLIRAELDSYGLVEEALEVVAVDTSRHPIILSVNGDY